MKHLGWKEVTASSLEMTNKDTSLSYLPKDASFAALTDLSAHSNILVRNASYDELCARFPNAHNARCPPEGLRRLLPDDDVRGYGMFTFPYGPIDAGVPEAGRFDIQTYGERILESTAVVGFKHRNIAASIEGLHPSDAALCIERIAGNLSSSHVSAFLAACESAEKRETPASELWTRALAQELQRIYNHLRVVAREAEAASQPVGAAQTYALAEEILRIQGGAFGHRWLFGALVPGGPSRRLDVADRKELSRKVSRVVREFAHLWELFLKSRIFIDRLQTTCPVDRQTAILWGAVGPTLRASNVSWDDRLYHPFPPYNDLFVAVPTRDGGDALARVAIRVEEIQASALLIEQILERWPSSTTMIEPQPPIASGRGLARVEAPSGDLVYDVNVVDGTVRHVAWRSPTEANFPLFSLGMRGAVFTDFHFAFESFGLVFAEIDG
jgi:Ni,Fe-hydrogenase III large subunit